MNLSQKDLKQVCYARFGPSLNDGIAAYVINGINCVFTGITISRSTINAAEAIIKLVCEQEGVSPRQLRFFDLQTHLGYRGKEPGEFAFSRLSFTYNPDMPDVIDDGKNMIYTGGAVQVVSWENIPCPDWVKRLFAEQIGPDPLEQRDPFDTKRRRMLNAMYN